MIRFLFSVLLFSLLSPTAHTQESDTLSNPNNDSFLIQSYEPNTIGWTKDADDVGFMDFKVSIKTPITYQIFRWINDNWWSYSPYPYFSFTGRFGQYIGTRHSSPVISKRFNPQLFFRSNINSSFFEYVDLGYAHESNGQSVDSLSTFQQLTLEEEKPAYAKDYISRGWDYLDLNIKLNYESTIYYAYDIEQYFTFTYFLPDGFFQGKPEEYNLWENDPEGKRRAEVNGIRVMSRMTASRLLKLSNSNDIITQYGVTITLMYETGYKNLFRYNSLRGELTFNIFGIPLMVWYANGYNSDLAQYFKRVKSFGVGLELN